MGGYGRSKSQQRPEQLRKPSPGPTRQAVEALDKSLDMEIVAREQRQVHIEEEIGKGMGEMASLELAACVCFIHQQKQISPILSMKLPMLEKHTMYA